MIPTVHEESFYVVRTPEGYVREIGPHSPPRTDVALADASRYAADAARGLAANNAGWEAVPAYLRLAAEEPFDPDRLHYYTLATYQGEYMLAAKGPLDWPRVVEEAVSREDLDSRDSDEPWEPTDILPILRILMEKHGVEVVRAARYYHLGRRSEVVREPGS